MKVKVDLTKEDFADNEKVDFYDSKTIFFEPTNKLPKTVNFKIWGADISANFNWSEYVNLKDYSNLEEALQKEKGAITVKGFSELTFENVVAGKIEISPYDKGTFVKRSNGEPLTYKREWTLDKIDADVTEYWLDTSIYFPYGACDLKLYAKGKVTFEFDPGDCIHYLDYITDKRRDETFWGYLKSKELTTNSYRYKDLDSKK